MTVDEKNYRVAPGLPPGPVLLLSSFLSPLRLGMADPKVYAPVQWRSLKAPPFASLRVVARMELQDNMRRICTYLEK